MPQKSNTVQGDALHHSPSVASVQFKVPMFVWVYKKKKNVSPLVHPSCILMCILKVRQRSAENTEKHEEKHRRQKGKYLNWLMRGSEAKCFFFRSTVLWDLNCLHVLSCSGHPCIQFTCLALKNLQNLHTQSRYGEVSQNQKFRKEIGTSLRRKHLI